MHRFLIPPARRVLDRTIRLPMIQDPGRAAAGELTSALMDPNPAMRLVKAGHRGRFLSGPVASPQQFVRPDGGTNTPDAMAEGAKKMNARRITNKAPGSSAGM